MSRKRPDLKPGHRVVLADHVRPIPSYGGKPAVSRDTILFVSSVAGFGSARNPFRVATTDGVHTWHHDVTDVRKVEEWVCVNCGQHTHPVGKPGEKDCFNECRGRGIAMLIPPAPMFVVAFDDDPFRGSPVSLVEFLADNADGWDGEVSDLVRLAVGQVYTCGGGASPVAKIARVS